MIKKPVIFVCCFISLPGIAPAATCSRINLTRCLDSACAINISSNPSARCQYCGTADAGTAPTNLRSVNTASSKNTISARDLKSAPADPGERYAWATEKCLSIVANCTTDDVNEAYDPLIEKSCTAAGLAMDMASLQKKSATNNKNATQCTNEITVCITADNKCGTDYSKCTDNTTFDGFFATCATDATGCTNFITNARKTIDDTRKNLINATASNLNNIIASHVRRRLDTVKNINAGCKNDTDFNKCVETVCKNNTTDNCASDKTIATNLCEFHKTACTHIKNLSEQEIQKELDDLMDEARKELNL